MSRTSAAKRKRSSEDRKASPKRARGPVRGRGRGKRAEEDKCYEDEKIVLFWGEQSPLSQWYAKAPFRTAVGEDEGVMVNCAEQAFMLNKARVFGDGEMEAKIAKSKTARGQKGLGRKVRNFDDAAWMEVAEDWVYRANLDKFRQDEELRALLLATGDKVIAEASPMDKRWGTGLGAWDERCRDPSGAEWKGENLLGKALMRVRRTLASEAPTAEPAAAAAPDV